MLGTAMPSASYARFISAPCVEGAGATFCVMLRVGTPAMLPPGMPPPGPTPPTLVTLVTLPVALDELPTGPLGPPCTPVGTPPGPPVTPGVAVCVPLEATAAAAAVDTKH